MPYRGLDPSAPTVYLDQSTLSDAFKASRPGVLDASRAAIYRPLREWIEHIAMRANLCLSFSHIRELARWNAPIAIDVAGWLESLPTVWLRPDLDEETEAEMLRLFESPSDAGTYPFKPSLLAVFPSLPRLEAGRLILSNSAIPWLLSRARQLPYDHESPGMEELAAVARADEQWAKGEGWSDARKAEVGKAQWHRDLALIATAADQRLRSRLPTWQRHGPSDAVVSRFVSFVDANPGAMRGWRVSTTITRNYKRAAGRRAPGSNSAQRLGTSALYDHTHAHGAAGVCDVFTCDAETSRWLAELRPTFGLQLQLSAGELGDAAFVQRLTAIRV